MKKKRPRDYGPRVVAPDRRKSCECGASEFDWSTNGDGASLQICKACGKVYTVGRFYQDLAVGVRIIALSHLSCIFQLKPDEA